MLEKIFQAIEKNDLDFIEQNIRNIDINQKNNFGYSLLHRASYYGSCKIVKLLLDNNADVNILDNHYETPLHSIIDDCQGDWYDCIELLLNNNADANTINESGESPLLTAVINEKWVRIIELLINHKANINYKDNNGDNSIRYAYDLGLTEIIELLEKNGAIYDGKLTSQEIMMRESAKGMEESYKIRSMIDFNSLDKLKNNKFQGFNTIEELWNNNLIIPNKQGVYLVLNQNENIEFLEEGVGGFFQDRNPNVQIDRLTNEFVPNSLVIYIGKANNLRRRLNQYLQFGKGLNSPHWGGRFIWQIQQHKELIICWKVLPDNENPREVERQLIQRYKEQFNERRPFANLQD